MPYINQLKVSQSSNARPLFFFENFLTADIIALAKQAFYPDPDWPLYETRIIYTVNEQEESVEVEFEDEVDFDEETGERKLEWQTKKYYFKNELESYLKREYRRSCKLLYDKILSFPDKYKTEAFIKGKIGKLLSMITEIERTEKIKPYSVECQRPFKALIREIYSSHSAFVPQKTDPAVLSILNENQFTEHRFEPQALSPKVCTKILELRDDQTELVFSFSEEIKNNHEIPLTTKSKLVNFIAGQFSSITSPIDFLQKSEAACYFIHSISKFQNFKIKTIVDAKIFKIKGNWLSESQLSKNVHAFTNKNSSLKQQIDHIIETNII